MVPTETGPVPYFHEPDIGAKSNINGVYLGHTVEAMERQLRLAVAAGNERDAQAAAALLLGSQNLKRLVFALARMTVFHRLHASTIVLADNDLARLFTKINSPAKAADGHAAWRHLRENPVVRKLIATLVHAIVAAPASDETVDATRRYFDAETHPFVTRAPTPVPGLATPDDAWAWLTGAAAADLAAPAPDVRTKLLFAVGGLWLAPPEAVTPPAVLRQLAALSGGHPAIAALVGMLDRNNERVGRRGRGYRGKLFMAAAALILADPAAHAVDAAYVDNPPACDVPDDIYRAVATGRWTFAAAPSRKRPVN